MGIIALVLAALVQDQIDNPEYKGWAPFKLGSSVTIKYIREGTPPSGEQKTTLKSIDENEAVLEVEFIKDGKAMGKPMERKVKAKIAAADAGKKLKEGEEEIEAAGKTLKCRTLEFEKKLSNDKLINLKFWISDEIPGKAVKVESVSEGAPKVTMMASAWEKK